MSKSLANIFHDSLVVSNDAGGAELICSYILNYSVPKYFYLTGPAIRIFKERLNISSNTEDLEVLISGSRHVITGTSWASDVEKIAISICKRLNKKVFTILDHWSDYLSRFKLHSCLLLPDVIIVVDTYAYERACIAFPTVRFYCG